QLEENGTTITVTVPLGSYLLSAFKTVVGRVMTAASNGLTSTLIKWSRYREMDIRTQNNGAIQSTLIVNQHFFEPRTLQVPLVSTCVIKLQSEDRGIMDVMID